MITAMITMIISITASKECLMTIVVLVIIMRIMIMRIIKNDNHD